MSLLGVFESECLIKKLKLINIENVGNIDWSEYHNIIEKLNIQSHYSAKTKHDEYVVNQLILYNKVGLLVNDLIVTEIWKDKVFPLILNDINEEISTKLYMILFHEGTLVNLLQIILYHSSSVEMETEYMLELCDYCNRKMDSMLSGKVSNKDFYEYTSIDDAKEETVSQKLERQGRHIEFNICANVISVLRFITDHITKTSVSVVQRIINKHDIVMKLIGLMEKRVFTKVDKDKNILKFNNNKWIKINKKNSYKLTKIEAEIWLIIYNLLITKECVSKYEIHDYRKNKILKLDKYLTNNIIDQIPILKQLKRYLQELSIMECNTLSESNMMYIEIIPEYRNNILNNDFKLIANNLINNVFKKYNHKNRQNDLNLLAKLYNFDEIDQLMDDPLCGYCGNYAQKRCSKCKNEWYCSRKCQVKSWDKHKTICNAMSN